MLLSDRLYTHLNTCHKLSTSNENMYVILKRFFFVKTEQALSK